MAAKVKLALAYGFLKHVFISTHRTTVWAMPQNLKELSRFTSPVVIKVWA